MTFMATRGRPLTREASPTNFGEWLKVARARRGFTVEALAESSGFSPGVISLWENGKRNPKSATIQQLARALASDGAEQSEIDRLTSRALLAAGFSSNADYIQRIPEELEEIVAAYTGIPDAAERAKARKVMETAVRVYGESSPDSEILEPVR